jgi:hypothetical protein
VASSLRGRTLFRGLEDEPSWKKFVVLVTGLKIAVRSVRGPPFQYPLEIPRTDESPGRKLVLMPDIQDDDSAMEIFKMIEDSGVDEIWVSNTLPFLVYIAIGYVLSLTLGDIALAILKPFFPSLF